MHEEDLKMAIADACESQLSDVSEVRVVRDGIRLQFEDGERYKLMIVNLDDDEDEDDEDDED